MMRGKAKMFRLSSNKKRCARCCGLLWDALTLEPILRRALLRVELPHEPRDGHHLLHLLLGLHGHGSAERAEHLDGEGERRREDGGALVECDWWERDRPAHLRWRAPLPQRGERRRRDERDDRVVRVELERGAHLLGEPGEDAEEDEVGAVEHVLVARANRDDRRELLLQGRGLVRVARRDDDLTWRLSEGAEAADHGAAHGASAHESNLCAREAHARHPGRKQREPAAAERRPRDWRCLCPRTKAKNLAPRRESSHQCARAERRPRRHSQQRWAWTRRWRGCRCRC